MAIADLYGTANQSIAWPDAKMPDFRVISFDLSSSNKIQATIEVNTDGWRAGYVNYYGNFYSKSDGSLGGTVTGFDVGTNDGYLDLFLSEINTSVDQMVAVEGDVQAARNLEASFFSGDDRLIGSADGGSVAARMLDGNDSVVLYGGNENDVNGNRGEDRFSLFGGGGRVRGGSDSDVIDVIGGEWRVVNGNNGNDLITNYSDFAGTVRGGNDDDTLINANGAGGCFYGDKGSDTFVPYSGEGGYMAIMDFNPNEDFVSFEFLSPNATSLVNDFNSDGILDTAIGVGGDLDAVIFGYSA